MTYFLVMGGLMVSLCFTLGWGLWRIGCWALGRLSPRAAGARRPRRRAARRPAPSGPAAPTRALARLQGILPLALVTLLLYGGVRLAAHGMDARPRAAPGGFQALVDAVGWGAAGLTGLAAIGGLAAWRCRRG
ncbi:hypothetical protein [Halomonas koreensis]|uniref:Uncharacterized protein n=1 Tax=Halomonas koreensis TaxID=245385 RepID=A0ABU1FY74_9GAMM|nr:hypothetical protein [Halomonas koreensis]MDR5865633.1 hypothetical protein [Halomonas koreensis]